MSICVSRVAGIVLKLFPVLDALLWMVEPQGS